MLKSKLQEERRTMLYLLELVILYLKKKNINVYIYFSKYLESGKIIKTVNAASADSNKKVNSVVIEEINILSNNESIRNLEIVRTMQFGNYLYFYRNLYISNKK